MNKFIVFLSIFTLLCCQDKHSECKKYKAMFKQSWNYTVKEKHYSYKGRKDYILEMTNGDLIGFYPVQPAFIYTNPGDQLLKNKNENWTFIISKNQDTIIARIYPEKCDSIISPQKFKQEKKQREEIEKLNENVRYVFN